MKLSIIIPIYNCEEYLEKCLVSAASQSIDDYEIICIDDCSSDNSRIILKRFVQTNSSIRIIKNNCNRGLSISRNIGISEAKGKYLLFLDSDDYISNNACEELVEYAEKKQLDMLAFGFEEEYENDELIKRAYPYKKIDIDEPMTGRDYFVYCNNNGVNHVISCGYLYRTEFLKANNIVFMENLLHEDTLFYFESLMYAKRVARISKSYYHYFRRAESITTSDSYLKKRFESLCIIGETLIKSIGEYKDNEELTKAIVNYYSIVITSLCNVYSSIDSFEKGEVLNIEIRYPFIIGILSCFYNGYFKEKLSSKEMQELRSYNHILIYGEGKVGKGFEKLLLERGIDNYSFVVSNPKEGQKSLEDYLDIANDCVVIIAAKFDKSTMRENAINKGFSSIKEYDY